MKKVLLIAGGGTLGGYTAKELLNKGCAVDVICLEDYTSNNPKLRYYKATADLNYLTEFLKDKYYDGIVNFIHYYVPEMDTAEPNELSYIGRQGTSNENANLICFLASDDSGYIVGQNIQIDGGRKKI